MRSEADLINIQATVKRRLTLDLERLEKDPVFVQITEQLNAAPGEPSLEDAVRLYLNHYIVRDQFPHLMPATNGPGDIDEVLLEVSHACN
jgi:hypothetical protein